MQSNSKRTTLEYKVEVYMASHHTTRAVSIGTLRQTKIYTTSMDLPFTAKILTIVKSI